MNLHPYEKQCEKCKRVYVFAFGNNECPYCKLIEEKKNKKINKK